MARFMVNKSVIQLRREQLQTLPPALERDTAACTAGEGPLRWCARATAAFRPIASDEELEAALS